MNNDILVNAKDARAKTDQVIHAKVIAKQKSEKIYIESKLKFISKEIGEAAAIGDSSIFYESKKYGYAANEIANPHDGQPVFDDEISREQHFEAKTVVETLVSQGYTVLADTKSLACNGSMSRCSGITISW